MENENPTLDDIKEMIRNNEDRKKIQKAMEESGYFGFEKDYTNLLTAILTLTMAAFFCVIILKTRGVL